jgi:hypothetical protein
MKMGKFFPHRLILPSSHHLEKCTGLFIGFINGIADEVDQLHPVFNACFPEDLVEVILDRSQGGKYLILDLFIGEALAHQFDDLPFAG